MDFIKKAVMRIAGAGTAIQVFSYFLGLYEETYAFIADHRVLVVICIVGYVFLYGMVYDAGLTVQKRKYNQRLKGAPVRRFRKPDKK